MNRACRIGAGLALGLAAAAPAGAVVCTVTPQAVSFGNYDPLSPSALNGAGNINVTCDMLVPFTVSLSAGNSGTFTERRMTAGAANLAYNLYSDVLRTVVWGDGVGAANVSGTGTNVDLPVYGRMPALQNVAVGSYADTITVTVTY